MVVTGRNHLRPLQWQDKNHNCRCIWQPRSLVRTKHYYPGRDVCLNGSSVVGPRKKKVIAKGTMEPGISCSIVSHYSALGWRSYKHVNQRSKLGPIRIDTPPDKWENKEVWKHSLDFLVAFSTYYIQNNCQSLQSRQFVFRASQSNFGCWRSKTYEKWLPSRRTL